MRSHAIYYIIPHNNKLPSRVETIRIATEWVLCFQTSYNKVNYPLRFIGARKFNIMIAIDYDPYEFALKLLLTRMPTMFCLSKENYFGGKKAGDYGEKKFWNLCLFSKIIK